MKISNNYSAETPYFAYIYTNGMKRIQFYADSEETASIKIELLREQYNGLDFIALGNASL